MEFAANKLLMAIGLLFTIICGACIFRSNNAGNMKVQKKYLSLAMKAAVLSVASIILTFIFT